MLDCEESENEIEFQEPDPGPTGFHAIRPEGVAAPQPNDPPCEPWFGLRGPQALPVEPLQEQAGVALIRCQNFNSLCDVCFCFKSEHIETHHLHQRSLLRTLCSHPPQRH